MIARVRQWESTRCLSVFRLWAYCVHCQIIKCSCKLTVFCQLLLSWLNFDPFFSPKFISNCVWWLMKRKRGVKNNKKKTRLKWRKSNGRKAGKTVGQSVIMKRWGRERLRKRERRMDGWMEREWVGWREEGFNPAWIMVQTGAVE